ncbi:DUF2971 domain-containing protein [Burkholderia seminalis]|uniref:DUF2971 domain-containing protein n=1 Tax=Burkholderia seminalis TaxID=488731 RepID=UPI000B0A3943|nr:DUF2971 domain-containing protein [Burkholderia seminalis]
MSNASGISAGRLYRILDFSRAVQIFESESLYFAHPRTWDDPYEARVDHQSSHALFAQCWCQIGVSDAMWRIYSPTHMGVRISTSTKKLSTAVQTSIKSLGYGWQAGPVEYLSQHDLNIRVRKVADSLRKEFDLATAVEILYMKREAFEHESEWRATIYCPDADRSQVRKGISVAINPHKFIDSILLDPRAPQELVDAFTYYFKEKLKFKGRVARSVLYKSPTRIQLVD